ncbi:MAG: sigma-54 dependent transcriptional regulator [Deltaproteobacteria bacterium]|nr:sigma-54 dependent transcriptional regulator [Deltaproteobacteria bacterium]
MPEKILIVDDEPDMLTLLRRIVSEKTPYEVTTAADPSQVPELLKKNDYDLVITDLKMHGLDGIQVLETIKQKNEHTAVVIMTAYGTIESAIETTRKGAFDYITKPFRKERILHIIEQAMKWQRLQRENICLRKKLEGTPEFPNLIGNSPAMQSLYSQINQVAKTTATILITGESGTGKELVARAIHVHSLRKDKTFMPVNCSAIPESLIESELFGHLRGSFTGAIRDKKGLVEEANQGTLFLDEIGDLSLVMQVKLLRLLQESEYKIIGDNRIRKVDIRFIAATNQNLPEKMGKGEFRKDLFYRLNVINLHLPPLQERTEDIPLLAHHFLKRYTILNGKNVNNISKEAMYHLVRREWPGNIRELENVIERGVVIAGGDTLEVTDTSMPGQGPLSPGVPLLPMEDAFSMPFKEAKHKLIEEFHTQYITRMLARYGGNVSRAAKELGLKRQYLHRLMREGNVDSKTFKK